MRKSCKEMRFKNYRARYKAYGQRYRCTCRLYCGKFEPFQINKENSNHHNYGMCQMQIYTDSLHFLLVFLKDLETQALTETENWRQQLAEVQEQQTQHIRAKQEIEAELERCKQVQHCLSLVPFRIFEGRTFIFSNKIKYCIMSKYLCAYFYYRNCSMLRKSIIVLKSPCRAASKIVRMRSKSLETRYLTYP